MAILLNQTNTTGTTGDDQISGTTGNDTLGGGLGNDTITGGAGSDIITGDLGTTDIAVFSGPASNYTIARNSLGQWVVTDLVGNDGIDTLSGIETLRFSDKDYSIQVISVPVGAEFKVNTTTANYQLSPTIAPLTDGGFVVTWTDNAADGSGYGVYGQRYAASGAASGGEFRVNTTTANAQYYSTIAALTDGGFVVTWTDDTADGSSTGVYGQRYAASGAASGGEFKVNTTTANSQQSPTIAALTDGGFVVTWMDNVTDGSGWGVYGQRYAASGAASGGEFRVNTTTANNQYYPTIAALTDGGFVVTWTDNAADGSGHGVYGQRYAATGAASGGEFRVNTTTANGQQNPTIAALTDGGFVVTWMDYFTDGSVWGVYGQRYDVSGAASGGEFRVNTTTANSQESPTIVALTDGGFVVTWTDYGTDGNGYGVYGQRYAATGAALGGEFKVNTTTAHSQSSPTIAALADGGFVVTWTDDATDGSGYGIYAQQFSSSSGLVGSAGNDVLIGGVGNEIINGAAGNDTITGGVGSDSIDGGAGINTYIIHGTADAFSRRWVLDSTTGTAVLRVTDLVLGGADTLNASDEGVDVLGNIQKLQFVLTDGTLDREMVLDDFANAADASNQQIQFGNWVNGRLNFYGDTDWLRVNETVGQKYVMFVGSGTGSGTYIGGQYSYDGIAPLTVTPTATQAKDFQIYTNSLSSSTPNSSADYSFILRRQLDGTTGDDTLNAGTNYEYLLGGAGNDTLNGSARSDSLAGGDGSDVLTGGAGNDILDGGAGANVAVFSGNRADYSIEWTGNNFSLKATHLNGGTDGVDTLTSVQTLRFADGDVVLDGQTSDPAGLVPNNLGQAMVGSLPGTPNWWQTDTDAFGQKFSGLNAISKVRIKYTSSGDASNGGTNFTFNLLGTTDALTFQDVDNPNATYTQFSSSSSAQTWFVTPQYWGPSSSGQTFFGDRADVSVTGYAIGGFGTSLNYSITVDRVQIGTANADTIAGDGLATYIDGKAGNDTVTGSALGEEIQGDAGDDTLNGGLGNDLLVGGAGTNTLNGGEGDDTLDVRQSLSGTNGVTDIVDGGLGVDTLVINAAQNIANMSVTNVEILQADGGVLSLTPDAVLAKGFTTANNITFRLDPTLANGGTLDASLLSGTLNLRGTNQSDVLKGNDQANTIYLQSDTSSGSGSGVDTVVAGAGDDSIVWKTNNWWSSNSREIFSSADSASHTYFVEGNLDGGTGSDKLSLSFADQYWYHAWSEWAYSSQTSWNLDLSRLTLTGIENLELTGMSDTVGATPSEVRLTLAQIASITTLTGLPALGIMGGGSVDFSQMAAKGFSNWRIADNSSYTITGTSGDDTLTSNAGVITLAMGAGDDTITLDGKATVTDTLDGGLGNDTLIIRGTNVDLSGATLSNIESIQVASQSLSLTAAQWAALGSNLTQVTGTTTAHMLSVGVAGATTTLGDTDPYVGLTGSSGADQLVGNASNNILVGVAGNDVISGMAGDDQLLGGAGNDVINGGLGNDIIDGGSGFNTYVAQGTADSFMRRISALGEWVITDMATGGVDLSNASDEGADTLTNIQKLRFVLPDGTLDSELVLDDFANAADATNQEIQFGNWVNGRLNFYGDTDWLRVNETAGQKYVMFVGNGTDYGTYIGGQYSYNGIAPLTVTPTATQVKDFQVYTNSLYSSTPNNSAAYSFVLRRQLDGTTGNDTLNAGANYEYLLGGAGDDTLNGSARSDYLSGGDGNDVLTGGTGNDVLDGGAGSANMAVFSGNKADYSFEWTGANFGLKVTHLNGGADGIDTLNNLQTLRFADGDVVLDTQTSDPVGLIANNVGQAMVGSLPGSSYSWVDTDAFGQKFAGLNDTSKIRIKYTASGDTSGQVYFNFKLIGTQDALYFADADNPGYLFTDFSSSGDSTWFVTPKYWGAGQTVFFGDRADVIVSGYANGAFGTFLNYSITVDRAQFGTASADTISGDGLATYIDGKAGNDTVTGSALGEEIQGGAGDDTLSGGLGNDILVGGAGTNTLNGGEDDDTLNVRQNNTGSGAVTDIVDGGAGVDTLVINADRDISNMSVTNVEILQADGGVSSLTPDAVLAKGFTTANNITFRLDPYLVNGGTLDASLLSGAMNLRGTNQSDVLKGNDQANTIYLQSDQNTGSGYGVDTVVAGAGDDSIVWKTSNYWTFSQFFSSVDTAGNTYFVEGNLDGGAGSDKLSLSFADEWWYTSDWNYAYYSSRNYDLSRLTLSGIESLELTGASSSEIRLTSAQVSGLSNLTGLSSVGFVGGGAIDLAQLAANGISNWRIADNVSYTITGTASADTLTFDSGVITLAAGDGNDTITLDGKTTVSDTLDGGLGNDTLVIRGTDVDLSGATLSNIESVQVASQSLSMTAEQWIASNVSRVTGANTVFLQTITTPGTVSLSADSAYVGLTGSSGDDRLIGNAGNNILVGGTGNDELTGNAGNDRLVSGAGIDVLSGGEGNDTLMVTGKTVVRDQFDGGAGTDTLQVSDGQNISAATLTGLEVLSGSGTVTLAPEQLSSFQTISGITVQLSGTSTAFSLGTTQLTNGARVLAPQADPTLTATSGILGSKGDDIIGGSAGADEIYGGRGNDQLDGGAGADVLIGGSGTDTLTGGAGDDVFRVESGELASWTTTYSDKIDGGVGSDTLELNLSYGSQYQINSGAVSNVERLVVNSGGIWTTVALTANTWNAFSSTLFSNSDSYAYGWINLSIDGSKNNINFNSADINSKIAKINLTGSFYDIDASNITLGPTTGYTDAYNYRHIAVSNFDSILLSAGNDYLRVSGDTSFTVTAGAGDDTVYVGGMRGGLAATIDGGTGTDTLDLSGSYFVDLTQATLSNIESIKYDNATLLVTDTQLAGWSFDGTGAKFTKTGNTIVGSADNDSYSGDGSGLFQGGRGNDTIMDVNTAVFTGNMAEYNIVRSGASLTVEHAYGTPVDGTDTLTRVMNLKFADTTMVLDDAPDRYWLGDWEWQPTGYLDFNLLTKADYDKRISAKIDYESDSDVFAATLAPSSPLAIDASSPNGNYWSISFKDVATGQSLYFKNLTDGSTSWDYNTWMSSYTNAKWLPLLSNGQAYQGGDVVLQFSMGGGIQDYAFTLRYLDDHADDVTTISVMDPAAGEIRGYIGAVGDADWVKTSLIAGTLYEFNLKGLSSGSGTLNDPSLALMDGQGQLVSAGIDIQANTVGGDDIILFRPTLTDTYFLAVKDVGGVNQGSWTLTQKSLDTIAGNVSTTERIEWTAAQTFSVSSEMNALGDHDWFKVWLDKGLTYDFRALGSSTGMGNTLSDPQLSVLSVSGNLLATDNNSGGGTDAKVVFRAADSGWYYLDAGAFGNTGKGTYTITGSSLADDYGNSVLTNGVVQMDTPLAGLVSYNGDSDWFKVGMTAGQAYVIDLRGDTSSTATLDPLLDPLLIIRDAAGNVLARADDFGGSLNARAYFTPTADGTYIIEALSAFKYDVGGYQLSVGVAPPDDFVNKVGEAVTNPAGAGALTLGTAMNGEISSPGDHDVFKLDLLAGNVYQLDASGLSGHAGTLVNPYLRVFDAQGHLLDFADNGGLGSDAQLYFAPASSGSYYFEVSANSDKGLGTYQITANLRNLPPDDAPNDLSTQVMLAPGDAFAGQLLTHNDQDWFAINLAAQKDYVFRVQASATGNGSLLDPVLELRGSNGSLLQSSDNSLISSEPFMLFNPTTTGTYYLAVKAANGLVDTGSYTLVTRAPDDHADNRLAATAIGMDQPVDGGIQWAYGSYGARAVDSVGAAVDADIDWFKFDATTGQVLSLSVQASLNSTLSRPMVEVMDANGLTLAFADGLETTNGKASATFKAAAAGTYYARVIDGAGATGDYQVMLAAGDASDEDSAAPVALDFANQGAISLAQATARIGLSGDTDTFNLTLQANHNYRIETVAVRDGATAPLQSASLDLSWLATGQTVAETIAATLPTGEPSAFESAEFKPATSGNLSVTVHPSDSTQTGQYKLQIVDLGLATEDVQPDRVVDYVDNTHGVLAINNSVSGTINAAGDADLYAINLTAGNLYNFSVKGFTDGLGTLAKGNLQLLDANGALVTSGRFDEAAGRENMSVSVFADGRYYLAVGAADQPGNTGTYMLDTRLGSLTVQTVDDMSADTRSGVTVMAGRSATGTIDFAGDTDWVSADLTGGKIYILDVLGAGDTTGGTLSDGVLRVLDATGNEVALDDNSGAGLDARLIFTPQTSQTYYFDVAGNLASTGSYTVRLRELYSGVADPLQSAQWYLPAMGLDKLNNQYSGAGVTIGMVDDGIDALHPDLQTQINLAQSYDAVYKTSDGSHKTIFDSHGTLVAGLMVAAANNQTGIVGVAQDAQIASTRVKWTWEQITDALGKQYQFDISNNSWSAVTPFGDNFNSTNLTFAYEALRLGVESGRAQNGTVFVFSAGNSASAGDNTNYHNFQNAREVIAVAAANNDGSLASFSTPGANVLVGAYGVGLLTSDRHEASLGLNPSGNYVDFNGTSAAAPIVSGVVALMLEANPDLGYRDVQKILALSATHPDSQTWKVNGATNWNLGGMHYNDGMGFGLVDAYAAVQLAETWTAHSTAINEVSDSARAFGLNAAIPDGDGTTFTRTFHIDNAIQVEHVELGVDLRHARLGDLIIELISPDGTVSRLMDRPTVNTEQPFGLSGADSGVPNHLLWDFSSVQFMGEMAVGDWTVIVKDVRAEEVGTLNSLSLRVYGQRADGNDIYVFTEEGFKQASDYVLQDESGIDTLNAAVMLNDVFVDLSAGLIASQGITHSIADWTVIEQAFTGKGNDRLVGNTADNWLQGRAGNDVLEGGLGNDVLDGGTGSDTVVYTGMLAEYAVSYDAVTRLITVVDNLLTGGDEGTDTLTGVERIVFSDGEMSLGTMVGNAPPVAKVGLFDTPVVIGKGMGINFDLPADAFTDADGEAAALSIVVSDPSGGQLPEWLHYDKDTRKFNGVPPENHQGRIKLLVEAIDEYGQKASKHLEFQLGDDQAPILDQAKELVLSEDAGQVALGLTAPLDPEGTAVTVTVLETPTIGAILDKMGNALSVGSVLSAADMAELVYQTAVDANGNAGYFRYKATDAAGVVAESGVHIFVDAVNDAPRFSLPNSQLTINYPTQTTVALDIAVPFDPESAINQVTVVELPALGMVTLNNALVSIGDVLSIAQLAQLSFTLSENVNGPIGKLGIKATDPQGLATTWTLGLTVQGLQYSSIGTTADDQMYGSIDADTLYGMGGNDTLAGNAGDDRLLGGAGDDLILGGSGNDAIDGGSGNDTIDGGTGNDIMAGGPGNDYYYVNAALDQVVEVLARGAGGVDTVETSVSLTAATNVENLIVAGALAIDLTGNELSNRLAGNDQANVLLGGAGADTLMGFAGNDTLDGGAGIDRLSGGLGDDLYRVDSRSDLIMEYANEGIDRVEAACSYALSSNVENITLIEGGDWSVGGNSLNNLITGNSGNNTLSGGLGTDTLVGGLGNDTYIINDLLDTISDVGGTDTIRTSLSTTLPVDIERLELTGLSGVSGVGNAADNVLIGNAGDNYLEGGAGVDTLTGGAGGDGFFIARNGSGVAVDTVTDFTSGEDLLMLDLASFGLSVQPMGLTSSGMAGADTFVQGAGAVPLDLNDHFIYDTAQMMLKFDLDGSGAGAAVDVLKLSGVQNLFASDIYLSI